MRMRLDLLSKLCRRRTLRTALSGSIRLDVRVWIKLEIEVPRAYYTVATSRIAI